MIKSFGETFPTLKVDSEMEHLLEKASVTKISVNHARNLYRIYLTSERLIFKKNIWKLEEAIQKQIFKSKDISVKIIESYQLSTQYTPRTLLDVYKDSILDELNSHSVLLYNLLRTAQWEFTDDTHVTLTIEETIIAKTRGNTIMEFLEKVFCERCGMDFIINIKYEKPKISKYRKNADKQIEQEVQNIIARTKFAVAGNEDIKTAENQNQDDDGSMFVEAGVSKPKNDGKMSEKVKKERKTPETSDDSSKNDRKFERKFEKRGDFRRKYDNDPDVIYGRNFDDEEITIDKIDGPIGEIVIKGQILSVETRNIRNEKTIIIFAVTDFTDTIMLKLFVRTEDVPEITKDVADGKFIKVKGVVTVDKYDSDLSITSIAGIKKIPDFTTKREDTAAEKRVELHCHTKMSDMDGVSDVKDIVKCAMRWGHKAIAITDHGDVQAFPDANHTVDDKFKVIYGVEAYLAPDKEPSVTNPKGQKIDTSYCVLDIETTGFSPRTEKITEIGVMKIKDGEILDKFSCFVNPEKPIPPRVVEVTNITDDMVKDAETIEKVFPKLLEFIEGSVLVAHNAKFDIGFLKHVAKELGYNFDFTYIDTLSLAKDIFPHLKKYKL